MKHTAYPLAFLLTLCVASSLRAQTPWSQPGPHEVDIQRVEWRDDQRNRPLPLKLYLPDQEDAAPVVLFSHGLGGTRDAATYLCEYWASHGYAVVAMQHPGSDKSIWENVPFDERREALKRAIQNPKPGIDRVYDVGFVLDVLARRNADDTQLTARFDLDRVAVAGHSFGAWTTLAVGGRTFVRRKGQEFRPIDPRIDALLPLSPPGPKEEREDPAKSLCSVRLPTMMMTGSLDHSPLTGETAEDRRRVFDLLPGQASDAGPAYLVYLNGGDHAVFGGDRRWTGRGATGDPDLDPVFHGIIQSTSTAFLEAYLRGDDNARVWLGETDLASATDDRATLHRK
ncbi:MAG: alpha/beta hydrolase family protein [Phycisphaeraceae bacterium]